MGKIKGQPKEEVEVCQSGKTDHNNGTVQSIRGVLRGCPGRGRRNRGTGLLALQQKQGWEDIHVYEEVQGTETGRSISVRPGSDVYRAL